jgi:hypothetical protein
VNDGPCKSGPPKAGSVQPPSELVSIVRDATKIKNFQGAVLGGFRVVSTDSKKWHRHIFRNREGRQQARLRKQKTENPIPQFREWREFKASRVTISNPHITTVGSFQQPEDIQEQPFPTSIVSDNSTHLPWEKFQSHSKHGRGVTLIPGLPVTNNLPTTQSHANLRRVTEFSNGVEGFVNGTSEQCSGFRFEKNQAGGIRARARCEAINGFDKSSIQGRGGIAGRFNSHRQSRRAQPCETVGPTALRELHKQGEIHRHRNSVQSELDRLLGAGI